MKNNIVNTQQMKNILARLFFPIFAVVGLISLASCDKFDDNGPFYGYWLITDIEGPEGPLGVAPELGSSTINTDQIPVNTENTITWAVRNELIMMHDFHSSDYYFFTFRRDATTLQLLEGWYNDGSNDTSIPFTDVPEHFYVPADGHYDVVKLDGKGMELRTSELTIVFKKN